MRRSRLAVLITLLLAPRAASPQGSPLGPEFRANTYTTGQQGDVAVAASSGNLVVAWTSDGQDGSHHGVFGQRYASSGIPLGPEFRVNTHTTETQYLPAIAADPFGNFVVVWSGDAQDGSDRGVFGQRHAGSGLRLGPEFRVNTYTTSRQSRASVGFDSSGSVVVVWESFGQDGSSDGVFGQRYASSGQPVGPEFQVNTYTEFNQTAPAVAVDSSGDFVVVWSSDGQDGSDHGIFGQRFASSGTPIGPEFRVNTYTTGSQRGPAVAASSSGNFVVVWESYLQDGSLWGLFGRRYSSAGVPLGPEFRVNTYTTARQYAASVASDFLGNFVVVWSGYLEDGWFSGVFGQRYLNSGAPLGPEFLVNTYTTGSQAVPAVDTDSAGAFVVVWMSADQDGSSRGVFGQRFGQILPVELMRFGVE